MKTKGIHYFNPTHQDDAWGMVCTGVGHGSYSRGEKYPASVHSRKYLKEHWERGRILEEWQLVYIHEGHGLIRYRTGNEEICEQQIQAGDLFILQPDMWHTYQPDEKTGWEEYWVGFRGAYVENIFAKETLALSKITYQGMNSHILLNSFEDLLQMGTLSSMKQQHECRHRLLKLLGMVSQGVSHASQSPHEVILEGVKAMMEQDFRSNETIESHLKKFYAAHPSISSISYSYFRRLFSEVYRISPAQYLDHLKCAEAKKLLHMGQLNIKQIAAELGFQNAYYFSSFFKKHEGVSPKFFKM